MRHTGPTFLAGDPCRISVEGVAVRWCATRRPRWIAPGAALPFGEPMKTERETQLDVPEKNRGPIPPEKADCLTEGWFATVFPAPVKENK
jgi:hypothetical protein